MKMNWLLALAAVAMMQASTAAMAEQTKNKTAAESRASETLKPNEKQAADDKSATDGQAAAPSGDTPGDAASGTTGSSTGGFSSSNRLNDPSPSRAMQPGGQY